MNASATENSISYLDLPQSLEQDELFVDQVGKTVARSLDKELAYLSPKVLKRLDSSRDLALTKQKKQTSQSSKTGIWHLATQLSPIIIVLSIVFTVAQWQMSARINDLAEVDSALLSDSVPPTAYADEGFKLFLNKMIAEELKPSASTSEENLANPTSTSSDSSDLAPAKNSANDPSNNQ
jgi:hypothetical protein